LSFNQVCCTLWKASLNLFSIMKTSVQLPEDIEKIDEITSYQLPNRFKIIGLVSFIVSILSIFIILICLENNKNQDLFQRIVWTIAILSLMSIAISKEKVEDELIAKIRLQSYHYAVIATVIGFLILPFFNYLTGLLFTSIPKIEGSKDIPIFAILFITQILTFRKLKKAYNEE